MVKGQAALFDGIMFLLITTMSVGMMYSAMVTYGESQDRVMRSAHVINYMQSIMKSIYFMDASTLGGVHVPAPQAANLDCRNLSKWKGTISVADLVKKDLADPTANSLDDKFGSADAPGKTALWCLMSEVMKPFTQAGYKYAAEVLDEQFYQTYRDSQSFVITDSAEVQSNMGDAFPRGGQLGLCDSVSNNFKEAITVAAPFRILVEDQNGNPVTKQYLMRVCVWPS
ncbi:MAG: hypothetical protein NTY90_02340 [Candidatus Micrarchaeota archaeon]|nr:hypothetical protein [Candidatus Micrarchaeota archaeon]